MANLARPNRIIPYLPHALAATAVVVAAPLATIAWLNAHGVLQSPLLSLALGVGLSWAVAAAASALWMRHSASTGIVFADLMIWGWLRRIHLERRIMQTSGLLAHKSAAAAGGDSWRQTELLRRLAADLEAGDPYTHGHSRRVARHAAMTAKTMGLDRRSVELIRTAAALHDVGKLHVPASVLNKPGRLTDEEFEVIKQHPVTGAEMVASIGNEELVAIVRHHHERLDGAGYPDRLSGDSIPMGARIIAVVDTFDAISSTRPYRPAAMHKGAIQVLKKEAGTQLDRQAVEAFLSYYSGRRSLAWWTFLANTPERLIGHLTGYLRVGVQGAVHATATAGTAALVGGSALVGSAALVVASPTASAKAVPVVLAAVADQPAAATPSRAPTATAEKRSRVRSDKAAKAGAKGSDAPRAAASRRSPAGPGSAGSNPSGAGGAAGAAGVGRGNSAGDEPSPTPEEGAGKGSSGTDGPTEDGEEVERGSSGGGGSGNGGNGGSGGSGSPGSGGSGSRHGSGSGGGSNGSDSGGSASSGGNGSGSEGSGGSGSGVSGSSGGGGSGGDGGSGGGRGSNDGDGDDDGDDGD